VTFVPAEVSRPVTFGIAESLDPLASGLLGDSEGSGASAYPWSQATTQQPTQVVAAKAETEVVRLAWDIVDEWGDQSFPASDPPANW
jgi:hypothetical protein